MTLRNEKLRISHLDKRRGRLVLDDINLCLYEGEVLGILGPHDAGKTMLLHVLCGREDYDRGVIFIDEARMFGGRIRMGSRVGLVQGQSSLVGNMSVAENIFVLRKHKRAKLFYNRKMIESQAKQQFEALGLDIDPRAKVGELSDCERYIVEIVKSYILGAEIILIDDFAREYPEAAYKELGKTIATIKRNSVSFVIAGTHFAHVGGFCDRVAVLSDHHILTTIAGGLGNRATYERVLAGQDADTAVVEQERRSPSGQMVFWADAVSAEHVRDFSFSLHGGEIVALADETRNANQELFELFRNPKLPHQGRMGAFGQTYAPNAKIGFADFRLDRQMFPGMSVFDNLVMPTYRRFAKMGVLRQGRLEYIRRAFVQWCGNSDVFENRCVDRMTEREKMEVYLYRLRVQGVRLLFCADPTRETDHEQERMIIRELRALAQDGAAVCVFLSSCERDMGYFDRFIRVPGIRE